jgi:PH (Pleckstrin Homology) domain-containing protein
MSNRRRSRRRGDRHGLGLPLQPRESVILVARPPIIVSWPKYLFTLGLYGIWRKRQTTVLTDRRILLNRGLVSRSERSIPFDRVSDARFFRRGYVGYTDLAMRGSGRVERIGPMRPKQARRLTSELLSSDIEE